MDTPDTIKNFLKDYPWIWALVFGLTLGWAAAYLVFSQHIALLKDRIALTEQTSEDKAKVLENSDVAQRSRPEKIVLQKKRQILAARASWINYIITAKESDRVTTLAEALPLAESLDRIEDSNLRIGYRISKEEYALYAYMMAADSEKDQRKSLDYCDKGISHGVQALSLIAEALGLEPIDDYHQQTAEWAMQNKLEERVNFLLALAYAVKVKKGDSASTEQARYRYSLISTEFKVTHLKYEAVRTLRPVLGGDL